ncbi:MAG: hypothetical protein IPI40_16810 [Betaproteobacteria bacterium]|nr:hypothetical protein [Betaproteobacteria bacterium]
MRKVLPGLVHRTGAVAEATIAAQALLAAAAELAATLAAGLAAGMRRSEA